MMVADISEVLVLAMISVGGETLWPPTMRRVWTLATVESSFNAVTWSSKTSTYAMKAGYHSVVVWEASVRLLVEPQEEGGFF